MGLLINVSPKPQMESIFKGACEIVHELFLV